jgi:hypothetical protein
MREGLCRLFAMSLVATAGCGDNSDACGPGTKLVGSTCQPADCGPGTTYVASAAMCEPNGGVVCTAGTLFDPTSGTCVIDPSACQNGTVLYMNQCVDPDTELPIDLQEGPEPNGYGVIEQSANPAGTITLKPVGGVPFVIHGHIHPFQDVTGPNGVPDGQLDPDLDTYVLAVTGPTMIHVRADGLNGIDGGFVADRVGSGDPMAQWQRFGIDVSNESSERQLFLPTAGTYTLTIADTRTLFQLATGGPVLAAPGGPDGDYYIVIDQLTLPAPVPLAVTGGSATGGGALGDQIDFYSAPVGTGLNSLAVTSSSVMLQPALLVLDNSTLVADLESASGAVGGFASGDTAVIAVDDQWNTAVSAVGYSLSLVTGSASPLSSSGGSATEPTIILSPPVGFGAVSSANQFYFDVGSAEQTVGMSIAFDSPVSGSLYDSAFNLIAEFTDLFTSDASWQQYTGLLRLAEPGRYYFVLWDAGSAATVTATSTFAALAPTAITESTPLPAMVIDPTYLADALTYDAGTDPWQTFAFTGTSTGGEQVSWFDAASAFGRIDPLTTSIGTSAPNDGGVTFAPVFSNSYAETGGTIGRVLLDDPSTSYFIDVRATDNTGSFTCTFAPRAIVDLGTVAPGSTGSANGNAFTALTANQTAYFLFHTTTGTQTTITATPDDETALALEFERVDANENPLGGENLSSPTAPATSTFTQPGDGWTAFVVQPTTPPATAQDYDVTVAPQ